MAGLLLSSSMLACGSDDKNPNGGDTPPPLFADRAPDETLQAAGVSSRVEIARDEFGVPHIFARTLEDAAFAQGYMHARDRLFQIDLFRHLVEGRLSEYFGSVTVDTDVQNRANMMTTDGRMVYEVMAEQSTGEEHSVLEAYSAGVNLFIGRVKSGAAPAPVAYDVPLLANWSADLIPEWRPADTLAIGRLQEMNLSDSAGEDIARGDAKTKLPADLYADLVRYQPADPIAILPDFYDSPFYGANGCTTISMCGSSAMSTPLTGGDLYGGLDLAKTLRAVRTADPFGMNDMPEGVEGSNNWVIAKEHTDNGHALVMNDPHLRFYVPPLFYHAQMDTRYYGSSAGDSTIIGISFPGIPGVLIGYNDYVAWGATTVGYDVTDVYVETLSTDETAVLFNGSYVPLLEVPEDIGVLGATGLETQQQVIEVVPHHGAIIPGSKANGKAMSRKWTGLEPMSSVGALLDRMKAKNIDDFMAAMSRFVVGAQNWNGADTSGNTGYMPGARIPIRNDVGGACDPTIPMDGTGLCEWLGMIPPNEVPRVKNRENGYVVTANNDVTGTLADNDPRNDPQYLHSSNADGFRARRITDRVEALMAAGKISKDQMQKLQADTVSLEAQRLMPFILAARDAKPDVVTSLGLADALARLAAWDFSNPSGVAADYRDDGGPDAAEIDASIAAAIFNAFRPRFYNAVLADEQAQYGVAAGDAASVLYLLENPTTSRTGTAIFDDVTTTGVVETADDTILKALKDAVDFLTTTLGSDPSAWRWGTIHQVEVQDLFGEFGVPQRKLGPFPRGGANSTIDVAGTGGALEDFTYFAGPQMRFIADVGPDGIVGESSLPGGQIDDPESPHYDDLLPLWLRNETFPYYFKPQDVVAHTEELIVLEPPRGL